MTEEQKDILIAKMLDNSESWTDEELDLIMNDEELRDIYDISCAVSGAYITPPEIDLEKEWQLFRPHIKRWRSPSRLIMKVAAIFLGVIALGGITANLVDHFMTTGNESLVATAQQPGSPAEILTADSEKDASEKGSGAVILGKPDDKPKVIQHHKSRVKQDNTTEETIEDMDIDIEELLRIELAKIDNEIALINAQQIEVDYNAMLLNHDMSETDYQHLTSTVNMLTMQ